MLWLDESASDGVAGQVYPVTQTEFFEDVGAVPFDGFRADHEKVGYLFGCTTLGDQLDNLQFPGGEDVEDLLSGSGALQVALSWATR